MMKPWATIAFLVLFGHAMSAQTDSGPLSSEALQSCLLGTPAETWNALHLTRDQLQRVHNIQEACKEECGVAGAKKQANPISSADGNTILSELDNILDDEQYSGWVAYCAGFGGGKTR